MPPTEPQPETNAPERRGALDHLVWFFLQNRLIVILIIATIFVGGIMVAPFDWHVEAIPRFPIAVDAIPDIGENQQIVFTEWPGRSPQDVEDQITYPLTVALLGVPGVETIRSFSFFGFSTIFIVFEDGVEFYWSRSRVLEKLSSLPPDSLPAAVNPALGPDATGLGQVFWYTLEGRDPEGNPAAGWDLHELRSIQDWQVRYSLLSATGVSEVASIGGYVQEYQIDVDPDAMHVYNIRLEDVFQAVAESNTDVGARTIEVNRVEYVVRGLGFIQEIEDIQDIVVKVQDNVPVTLADIAHISRGPAMRRGVLDKAGAEAVGGVVVVRYGANPLSTINNVKEKIGEIAPGLPVRVVLDEAQVDRDTIARVAHEHGFEPWDGAVPNHAAWLEWLRTIDRAEWPEWITTSTVTIVPFYDRTTLINETLGTLNDALVQQILVTVIVILVMIVHVRGASVVSLMLPLAVLMTFLAMKVFEVDANIVALAGIAIAIGTVVDMGIILTENVLRHLQASGERRLSLNTIYEATREVAGAIVTSIGTTVVGFLPVFTMTGPEGKLFSPLAYTKTFALIASLLIALIVLPTIIHVLFRYRAKAQPTPPSYVFSVVIGVLVAIWLTREWMPLGIGLGFWPNFVFITVTIFGVLGTFRLFIAVYPRMLRWCLEHKLIYATIPIALMLFGVSAWLGVNAVFGWLPEPVKETRLWAKAASAFPGFGNEFMPPLDEGSYLYMPVTMPHASIGESYEMLQFQDRAIAAIPEVDSVVGKIGRVDSPLDPAPISMVETVVSYKPEYKQDASGRLLRFRYDEKSDTFLRDESGELIPDPAGRPYRQWRPEIQSADDIWDDIVEQAAIPGATQPSKLQPIAARLVMLQSGIRAPMGVKIQGPDLETIERVGLELEERLKNVPGIDPQTVFADRIVGKPYLEIHIDRKAIARYGLQIMDVQNVIEVAVGGRRITTTVEGRERYPVRVRYMRELRDQVETLERVLVSTAEGSHIPLEQIADIEYVRGPMSIRSEDTFLVGYVLFDKQDGYAELDVVDAASTYLEHLRETGELVLPQGVSYTFAGNYENQLHAERTLNVVRPVALLIIFVLLYLQFRRVAVTMFVFSVIFLAWSGGFILMWLYAQPGFLDFNVFGVNLREAFQIGPVNMSVAVWVGFLALFGIASDDAVVMATYIKQTLDREHPKTVAEIRQAVIDAGTRRIRPCLMTTATTLLALLPVMTSQGRGADLMIPMAIPIFGGMVLELITPFLVPVLYSAAEELRVRRRRA